MEGINVLYSSVRVTLNYWIQVIYCNIFYLTYLFKKYPETRKILYETVKDLEHTVNEEIAAFIVSIYTDQEFSNLNVDYKQQNNLDNTAIYTAATKDPRWRSIRR